ncbi:EmrB/QacA subfamily drug resistance transporter [Antricoccus suffuscus]|uniref:EmrB/QacA subfamily drug resistance transporter n=1 Tax=Antricoccus suffuscus TaxID=1629062 RepID=A0A2T1A6T6_9ACTN|nr:MFS transporter [Antricoccus suffuscus]PRZ44038.1 EmrB/QacA subfamily drug resistance transporter [Antricoccus suffuscus]
MRQESSASEVSAVDTAVEPDPTRWRILSVLLVAIFMSLIGVSIVNVALPSIQHGLGASESDLQWVLSGYALTFGIVLVTAGRGGDLMGRGGFFIIGVTIFTASSVAAGFAPTPEVLNVARFAQGVGSGLLNPQGVGMIQQYFRGAERGRAFGYFGSTVGVSVAIGPVLGGLLIKAGGPDLGWRITFLVNLPVGLIAIILAFLWFPRPLLRRTSRTPTSPGQRVSRSMDPVGSILLGLAVLAVLFPFVEAQTSALTWLLIPLGLVLVAIWVWWERRYARRGHSPMVELNIFRTRSFTNGTVIVGLYFLGMTSVWVLVAMYMQEGLGKSALEAGLIGVPSALLSALAANWAGKRVMTYGRKVVIGGLLCGMAGLLLSIAVVLLHEAGTLNEWWLLLPLCLVGVAQGSVISPNQTLTLADVPLDYAGSSGAIMQTGQRIGTSIGIAVITAVVFATLGSNSWSVAVSTGFALICVVVLLALGVALKDLRDRAKAATSR